MPSAGTTPGRKLVCLTGFMGCGKSTVGRLLAQQLGWRFYDLDYEIEHASGLSISAIFDERGEPAFRQIEHNMLAHLLGRARERHQPTVVALGGGTLAQPQNQPVIRDGATSLIWLDCPLEILLLRCVNMPNRPLFRDETSFRELYAQRRPFYEQADYRVASDTDPRIVVERILALGIFERVNV